MAPSFSLTPNSSRLKGRGRLQEEPSGQDMSVWLTLSSRGSVFGICQSSQMLPPLLGLGQFGDPQGRGSLMAAPALRAEALFQAACLLPASAEAVCPSRWSTGLHRLALQPSSTSTWSNDGLRAGPCFKMRKPFLVSPPITVPLTVGSPFRLLGMSRLSKLEAGGRHPLTLTPRGGGGTSSSL